MASATLVGDTPGTVGYGGNVTDGSPSAVAAVDAVAAIAAMRVVGPVVGSSGFFFALLSAALSGAASSVCAAVSASTAGATACSASAVDDFCLASASTVFSVSGVVSVVEPVGAVVVSVPVVVVGVVPAGEPSFVTVVPEPPEALTVDVGPSPVVVVVVCVPVGVPEVVAVLVSVVEEVVLEVPEVGVADWVLLFESAAFDPVSVSAEPAGWSSPVVADATPGLVATAIPSPTANAKPLARFARAARFACRPRLAEAIDFLPTPQLAVHEAQKPGHETLIN
jgi:hypothetical protein